MRVKDEAFYLSCSLYTQIKEAVSLKSETEKIDAAVATIMALDRAIRCGGETGESVYDGRGLIFI